MLVQLTSMDPIWTLFTVIGILTLFGKKKKDEKEDGETVEASTPSATLTPSSPTTSTPIQASPVPASSPTPPNPSPVFIFRSYQPPRSWQGLPQGDEDSSLSRLLQSLLKDLPSDASSMGSDQPRAFTTEGLSEWVPPRATPTSRPMVIVPGGKKGAETDKTAATPSPPAATVTPPPATTAPPPPAPPVRSVKPPEPVEQTP